MDVGFRSRPIWCLALAALVAGNGTLALKLFGSDPIAAIGDDRAVVSGRHTLHLYHGKLGAETFRASSAVTCYDPQFQAGYPKTPVFDCGSRFAEFVIFTRPTLSPAAAYKLGILFVCFCVPFVFAAAGRGFGLPAPVAGLAALGGCFVWWTPAVQSLLDAGQLDGLLLGLAWMAFAGGMARYAADPGLTAWSLMALASVVGWYIQPLGWLGVVPLLAFHYVLYAPRHGLAWHLGWIAVLAVGIVPNLWWLADWSRFWWLRRSPSGEQEGWPAVAAIIGDAADYRELFGTGIVGWLLPLLALGGLVALVHSGRRGSAGLLAGAALCAALAARLGSVWELARCAESAGAALPAVAVIPAAFLIGHRLDAFRFGRIAMASAMVLPFAAGEFAAVAPLQLRPTADQEFWLETIRAKTVADARILIEDDQNRPAEVWPILLALGGERSFIGGLDAETELEHCVCGFGPGFLQGRPLGEWTNAERTAYCDRYNIGWVFARSQDGVRFWEGHPDTRVIARQADGVLFEVLRRRSFVLSGTATIAQMDCFAIVLVDAVPDENGWLKLSLHHQNELRVVPLKVTPAPDIDPAEPIPMLKLQLPGPVSRITITWPHP